MRTIDALEKPELAGKKIKLTVNNALSNMIDRLYGKDIISRVVEDKNKITYVLPYDSRFDYLNRRFHRKYEVQDKSTIKAKEVEKIIRDILSRDNEKETSKISLFEVEPGTFVVEYDDGDVDFSELEFHEDGTPRFSFTITGGLNGSGSWEKYMKDLSEKFKELEDKTGLRLVIEMIQNDVADDVWTAQCFLYDTEHIVKDSKTKIRVEWSTPEESFSKNFNSYQKALDFYTGIRDGEEFWSTIEMYDLNKTPAELLAIDQKSNSDILNHLTKDKVNSTLNPKIWNADETLKPEIKEKVEEVVQKFTDWLKDIKVEVKVDDILLVGSNASYNYDKTSDLDIHILVNENDETMIKLLDAYKALFNDKYDIEFKNINVEVYVQNEQVDLRSNNIYSLNNGWVKKIEAKDIVEPDISEEIKPWEKEYEEAMKSKDIDKLSSFMDKLKELRKAGMEGDGEYSKENMIFKAFRKSGKIKNLKALQIKLINEKLSINDHLLVGDVIRKTSKGYVVFSESGKKLSKAYQNREDAEKRLKQIEMFKHMKDSGYNISKDKDHYFVYFDGEFIGSADNQKEIEELIELDKKERNKLYRYEIRYLKKGSSEMQSDFVIAHNDYEAKMKTASNPYLNVDEVKYAIKKGEVKL